MKTKINLFDDYAGRINDNELGSYTEGVKMAIDWVNRYYPEKAPSNYKIEIEFSYYEGGEKLHKLTKSIVVLKGSDINRFRKLGIAI